VQHHTVDQTASELERAFAQRGEHDRDVLVERRVEAQHRELAGRAVVSEDDLPVPQAPLQFDRVGELRHRDGGQAHDLEQGVEPTTEAEGEPAAGQPVHRHGEVGGDQRMARVVVRGRGCDAERRADGTDRATERRGVLGVEPLGDERGAQTEALRIGDLVHEVARRGRMPRQCVEAELAQLVRRIGHE
jgi:hypothetical protein